MVATATITTRIDENVKREASIALEAMGLTLSGAVNMFLTRVAAEGAIPFDVRVPNAVSRSAMAEADEIASRRAARFADAEKLVASLETDRD